MDSALTRFICSEPPFFSSFAPTHLCCLLISWLYVSLSLDLGEKGCGLAGPGRVPRFLDQVEVEKATYFAKTKTLWE